MPIHSFGPDLYATGSFYELHVHSNILMVPLNATADTEPNVEFAADPPQIYRLVLEGGGRGRRDHKQSGNAR